MKMGNSPLYNRINEIDDPTYRTMLYYIVEDLWEEFYNKTITTISKGNKKGYNICSPVLDEWELFSKEMGLSKRERDQGRVLCYLEPAWVGAQLSTEKVAGWKNIAGLYRNPRWKENGKDKFIARLYDYFDKFYDSKLGELFRDVYYESFNNRISIIYRVAYISANRR